MGKGDDPNSSMLLDPAPQDVMDPGLPPAVLRAEQAAAILDTPEYRRRLQEMPYSLIVDLDDTLISNRRLFDDAQRALDVIFVRLDRQHRPADQLRRLHQDIDADNISLYGYSPRGWYMSAYQAAEQFAGRTLTEHERRQVRRAAALAMGTGQLLPGVAQTLQVLQDCDVPMLLKTKGSRSKQNEKLAAHQLARFFGTRMEIVEAKDRATFTRLAAEHQLARPVSIGDSGKSDIAPALSAGFDAILLDKSAMGVSSWAFEEIEGLDVPVATSFPEAVLLLADRGKRHAAMAA